MENVPIVSDNKSYGNSAVAECVNTVIQSGYMNFETIQSMHPTPLKISNQITTNLCVLCQDILEQILKYDFNTIIFQSWRPISYCIGCAMNRLLGRVRVILTGDP
jgi:hypothetical protein